MNTPVHENFHVTLWQRRKWILQCMKTFTWHCDGDKSEYSIAWKLQCDTVTATEVNTPVHENLMWHCDSDKSEYSVAWKRLQCDTVTATEVNSPVHENLMWHCDSDKSEYSVAWKRLQCDTVTATEVNSPVHENLMWHCDSDESEYSGAWKLNVTLRQRRKGILRCMKTSMRHCDSDESEYSSAWKLQWDTVTATKVNTPVHENFNVTLWKRRKWILQCMKTFMWHCDSDGNEYSSAWKLSCHTVTATKVNTPVHENFHVTLWRWQKWILRCMKTSMWHCDSDGSEYSGAWKLNVTLWHRLKWILRCMKTSMWHCDSDGNE